MREPVPEAEASFQRLRRILGGGGWTPDQPAAPAAVDPVGAPGPTGPASPASPASPVGSGSRVSPGVPADTPTQRIQALVAASPQTLMWLAAAALAVVLATGYVMSHHHGGATAYSATTSTSPGFVAAGPTTSAAPSGQIVVDVSGRVRHPGLVTLPAGARVADAVAAAGGALHPRDLATVNLASRVADGQLLLIGVRGVAAGSVSADGGGGAGGGDGSGGLVDLNSATVDQLDQLPGVGPVLAQRIVTWRDQHGGFASVDQLQQVSGIGPSRYDDLKSLVSV